MTISPRSYGLLAQLFTRPVVDDLAFWKRCGYIETVVKQSGYGRLLPAGTTLGQLFDHVYDFLKRNYRSEYVYKNALADKILMGRHSVNTSTLLTEFRAGAAQADVVVVNGTSCAYEIKSELDTMGRLPAQLAAYLRVFDQVYVVTHESLLAKVERAAPPPVGIILLTRRYTLRKVRPALSNAAGVDPSVIFTCLRRGEYCQILESEFGYVPDAAPLRFYAECRRLFSMLAPETAHRRLVEKLRARASRAADASFIDSVPRSLRLLCLARSFTAAQRDNILCAINSDYVLNSLNPYWSSDLNASGRRRDVLSIPEGQAV